MAKVKSQNKVDEILKVPVTLADFKFKKMSGSWDITFELQAENLALGKPLMDSMGDHFVLTLVKVDSNQALENTLGGKVSL